MQSELIQIFRNIIAGDTKSWVLFANATCVILAKPEANLAERATELMKEHGLVRVGSFQGDFGTIKLINDPGWAVTCHHPDIFTYVSPNELGTGEGSDLGIGLLGRSKRDQDAKELHIIHVEDRRASSLPAE